MTNSLKNNADEQNKRKNYWYVLFSIAGHVEDYSQAEIQVQNRMYWNAIMRALLEEELERGYHKSKEREKFIKELPPYSEAIREEVSKHLLESGYDYLLNADGHLDISILHYSHSFWGITFEKYMDFSGYYFVDNVIFNECVFNKQGIFDRAIFLGDVSFENTEIRHTLSFKKSSFYGDVKFFSSIIENAIIDFSGAQFYKIPPALFTEKLPNALPFTDCKWPKFPKTKPETQEHVIRYERLAKMMEANKQHHDRHFFYRKEIKGRRLLDRNIITRLTSWLYDILCNYGYGLGRAIGLWVSNILIGAMFLLPKEKQANVGHELGEVFLISFANAHSFLGLNKGSLKPLYEEYEKLEICFGFHNVWFVQSILGTIFLFLLALTIRNRFRMG